MMKTIRLTSIIHTWIWRKASKQPASWRRTILDIRTIRYYEVLVHVICTAISQCKPCIAFALPFEIPHPHTYLASLSPYLASSRSDLLHCHLRYQKGSAIHAMPCHAMLVCIIDWIDQPSIHLFIMWNSSVNYKCNIPLSRVGHKKTTRIHPTHKHNMTLTVQ